MTAADGALRNTGLFGSGRSPTTPFRARASYSDRAPGAVLVLQSGENPSVDYYLRPRLEATSDLDWAIANLKDRPATIELLQRDDLWVVICRYINRPWLNALKQARARLAGVSYFVDDDLAAVLADEALPASVRSKVRLKFAYHQSGLESVASEIWASTKTLARQADLAATRILPPLPCDDPASPSMSTLPLVLYHGTESHAEERKFVHSIAERLVKTHPSIRFEVAGRREVGRRWRHLQNASIIPQSPWPRYMADQQSRRAAILLAPLTPTAVNHARAPVKMFDAARVGAVGVYADAAPYAGVVRDGIDGLLLPMDADQWAQAIAALIEAPARRFAMAAAAYDRVTALRASIPPLF